MTEPAPRHPLLRELADAGFPPVTSGPGARRAGSASSEAGFVHRDGNRYWAVDVSGMLALYQELCAAIFARRLALWGAGEGAGSLLADGLILFWGPDNVMRDRAPASVAQARPEAGDGAWADNVEWRWRDAADCLGRRADSFWNRLRLGRVIADSLREMLDAKVTLDALGVDSLIPRCTVLER